ncbi:MAG: N-6 DNA methylase [Synergistaceae bacterium]|nr:N-6 DNA methylase [Synergistaceae bacterium]
MSEELIQRNLIEAPEKIGAWDFYNIGATTLKALREAKAIPDRSYAEYEGKKPDALIVKKPQVIAAIEYKTPKELRTKKQIAAAISQELGTAQALCAKIYIVTDGQKSFWVNPLTGRELQAEDGSRIALNFNKNDIECVKLINKAIASIDAKNDIIRTSAMVDPLPLAQRVWQDLWAVSGATPENCLYTFVEIFIFKYLSDLGVLPPGLHSFSNLLAQYKTNTENEVLEHYASAVRVKIKELFPWNPKDKTTIINGTLFVSKDDRAVSGYATVFKKILERFEAFGTLENIDYDFKSKLFETFLKESISKKNWGQFFTPLKVVRAIVRMADVSAGMKICDPACGVGKFLLEPIIHDIHRYYKIEDGQLKPQITLSGFDKGFDKDEQKTIILAKANMLIYMSALIREHSNITEQFAKLFNDTFLLQTNSILGTLAKPITDEYDLILTNPPYVMSGSSNLKEEISKQAGLKSYFSISAMGIEGLFMEWIIRALKPDGKAFVVVPDGIMNRSNDKRLRDFILDECEIDAVISLPLNTFFTTNKKTYIMALTKKIVDLSGSVAIKPRQTAPVFTYLCSEIGETRDVYRFDLGQNDLDAAATLYNAFKGTRGALPFNDKRCKIVGIDAFYNSPHWSVERWWAQEEKVALGIEDDIDSTDINQFVSIIEDISASMLDYREPLLELEKKKNKGQQLKQISLLDESVFRLVTNGIGLNKTQLSVLDTEADDDVPVYTAAKEPVAFVKRFDNKAPIQSSDGHPMLSFATNGDGSAGRNFVIHRRPFYINVDRIAVDIVLPDVLLSYLQYQLSDMKEKHGFNHSRKANRHNLANVSINVPIDVNGSFDLAAQRIIAEQFTLLNDMRRELEQKRFEISKIAIKMPNAFIDCKMKRIEVSEAFLIERGNGKYTKAYTQKHRGEYSLYSGNTTRSFAAIDSFDYDVPCLSWVIDGLAGYMMCHDNPFSATNHRGVLLPKSKRIDLGYAKYILEPLFRREKKGRLGENGENEYTSLPPFMIQNIEFDVPVNDEGIFDVTAQQEIAKAYNTVEQYKKEILGKLDTLITQKVSL